MIVLNIAPKGIEQAEPDVMIIGEQAKKVFDETILKGRAVIQFITLTPVQKIEHSGGVWKSQWRTCYRKLPDRVCSDQLGPQDVQLWPVAEYLARTENLHTPNEIKRIYRFFPYGKPEGDNPLPDFKPVFVRCIAPRYYSGDLTQLTKRLSTFSELFNA